MAPTFRLGQAAAMLLLPLAGCSFFGIDNRPDIEYATMTERRPVKEPMYQRQIPGTNLVKRWPARRGLNYGYAPWENKQDAVMVAQQADAASADKSAAAAPSTAPQEPGHSSKRSARTAMADPQVKQAADWSPRHEAALQQAKSHRKPPVRQRAPAADDSNAPLGLIQPRTMAPQSSAAEQHADEEIPNEPTSNLPNVYDPSDAQSTPEDSD